MVIIGMKDQFMNKLLSTVYILFHPLIFFQIIIMFLVVV